MTFIIEDLFEGIRTSTDHLWESARSSFTPLDRLRRILGSPGQTDLLDHFREIATGVPQPLDLPSDIVRIVCETRGVGLLCHRIIECKPTAVYRNFDKLQAAAPGIILATRLEGSWATWHEYRNTEDVSEYAEEVRELLTACTSTGFLMHTLGDFYFRIWTYEKKPQDFLRLFPSTDGWAPETAESFKLMAAAHIATYFREARHFEIPNRPDIICQIHFLERMLKQDLLEVQVNNKNILD